MLQAAHTYEPIPCASTASLLDSFGVQIHPAGDIVLVNFDRAIGRGHLHHSVLPVAVVALSLTKSNIGARGAIARHRFPKDRLAHIVALRPNMDSDEIVALAEVCGVDRSEVSRTRAPHLFIAHLLDVLERYDMEPFFGRDPLRPGHNDIDVRPRGFNWRTDEDDPKAMAEWRRAYKALPPARQMMVATVLWLYRGGPAPVWLTRVPYQWHAADAIVALRDAGALRDWGKLVALYPGW